MSETTFFNTKRSIQRALKKKAKGKEWAFSLSDRTLSWDTKMERVEIIRQKLPFESIEVISMKANLPVKRLLYLLEIPQTTYNKKKREKDVLSSRDSEIILELSELIDFGVDVFNDDVDKFHRWLSKPNISLGGITPESLFDLLTGIQEVRNALNRIEYGNMA